MDLLDDDLEEEDAIMALSQTTQAPPSSYSPASSSTRISTESRAHSPDSRRSTGAAYVGTQSPISRSQGYRPGYSSCRLCLGSHPTTECPHISSDIRDNLLAARERNYSQKRNDGTWVPRRLVNVPTQKTQAPIILKRGDKFDDEHGKAPQGKGKEGL